MLELIGRFINPLVIAGLLALYIIIFFAKKKFRISSFVLIAILVPLLPLGMGAHSSPTEAAAADSGISETGTNVSLTDQLNSFFRDEAERAVTFSPPAKSDAPFDIIFLQICSLSWDDLDFTKQRDNPLFGHFDIIFSNFNSAASYSGPSAIRLLRGSCGQPSHEALYTAPQQQCLTMENLRNIRFEPQLTMNHDGHYGGFLQDVTEGGGLHVPPIETKGLPAYLKAFDGTPIYNDFAVLSGWWSKRLQSPAERVALYYNSISLHDGNTYPNESSASTAKTYPPRLSRLLEDMDRFFSVLQASGRRAVVVFVAEHGASMRGDKTQIAGLREIPSPSITTVPVGIKLIGLPDNPGAKPLIVSKPTSHLAVSQLLSNFITISPFGQNKVSMDDYVRDLPSTDFVSENSDVTVMLRDKQYFIHSKGQEWIEYDTAK